jgi:hypothetical protein
VAAFALSIDQRSSKFSVSFQFGGFVMKNIQLINLEKSQVDGNIHFLNKNIGWWAYKKWMGIIYFFINPSHYLLAHFLAHFELIMVHLY